MSPELSEDESEELSSEISEEITSEVSEPISTAAGDISMHDIWKVLLWNCGALFSMNNLGIKQLYGFSNKLTNS